MPTQPERKCVFQIDNVDRQGSREGNLLGTNYFAGGNVRLSCRGQQLTMQSDSVAAYGGNVVKFIGNVKYRDSTLTMDADHGTYYRSGEKWEARGRIVTRNLKTGSTLTGPSLDYFRVVKGVRDTMEMFATGRPGSCTRRLPPVQTGRGLRHRSGPDAAQGQRSALGRRQGDHRSQRFRRPVDSLRLDTGPGRQRDTHSSRPVLRGNDTDQLLDHGRSGST